MQFSSTDIFNSKRFLSQNSSTLRNNWSSNGVVTWPQFEKLGHRGICTMYICTCLIQFLLVSIVKIWTEPSQNFLNNQRWTMKISLTCERCWRGPPRPRKRACGRTRCRGRCRACICTTSRAEMRAEKYNLKNPLVIATFIFPTGVCELLQELIWRIFFKVTN